MKVATLTFHKGLNHGGFLQAYCLAQAIQDFGHDVEIINYKNKVHELTDKFNPWVYRNPFNLYFNWKKNKTFQKSFKQLPLTPYTTDVETLDWSKYDAIVVGSDIVWNYELNALGHDTVYFGHIPESFQGKMIAYAPSCGQMSEDFQVPHEIKEGMKRYSSIGVRDLNTQLFAKRHNPDVDSRIVVDPTWLTCDDRGKGRVEKERGDYILLYAYSITDEVANSLRKFANEEGLKILGTGYYQSCADKQLSSANPFDWVDLVANAKYVVAGTFHAALYAMRESVPFVVLPQHAINTKLKGPMTITGLQNRILKRNSDFESILKSKVDFKSVQQKIKVEREFSLEYLREALKV